MLLSILFTSWASAASPGTAVHWSFENADIKAGSAEFLVDGKRDKAIWLNGSNHLEGRNLGRFEQLTVTMWLRLSRLNDFPIDHIGRQAAKFTMLFSGANRGTNSVRLGFSDDGKAHFYTDTGGIVSDGSPGNSRKWLHIAAVYDKTVKTMRLYIDGRLSAQGNLESAGPISLDHFVAGAATWGYPMPVVENSCEGLLDDLRIYRAALDEKDINTIIAGNDIETKPLGVWDFDSVGNWPKDDTNAYWSKRWRLEKKPSELLRMARIEDSSGNGNPLGVAHVRDFNSFQALMAGWPSHGQGLGVIFHKRPKPLADSITGQYDLLDGNIAYVNGVKGKALKFDGFTVCGMRHPVGMPNLENGFTIEAWIAPQEYSWNQTAIINQHDPDKKSGFFFGIDTVGKLVFAAAVDGQWRELVSKRSVELLKWSHVVAALDPESGLKVFINGKESGHLAAKGKYTPADNIICVIGESMSRTRAKNDHNHPYCYAGRVRQVFDGLMDELKIYETPLSATMVREVFAATTPADTQPLKFRHYPKLPEGPHPFGAYYTKLNYSPEFDAMWRMGDYADVVVQFDNSPTKLVFWHGANYIPALVSENGLWMTDQALEYAWGVCSEAIVDHQCRWSYVRVVENTPARVVVHWRSALNRPDYKYLMNEDQNGWPDWVDEYWYVYPDGVCLRQQVLWTSCVFIRHDFVETIMFNQPGHYPWDTVEWAAVTVGDMKGNKADWQWTKEGHPPRVTDWGKVSQQVKTQSIQIINFRSKYKPFSIWFPDRFAWPWGEGKFMYPFDCWSHWPVGQLQSDGINAPVPDRPTHTSLNNGFMNKDHGSRWDMIRHKVMYGMTDQPFETLVPLARSWNYPPAVTNVKGRITSKGYDKYQRAYLFETHNPKEKKTLSFELQAGKESPLVNAALVISNWGDDPAKLKINGRILNIEENYKLGYNRKLDSTDLIVWIKHESTEPVKISLSKVKK